MNLSFEELLAKRMAKYFFLSFWTEASPVHAEISLTFLFFKDTLTLDALLVIAMPRPATNLGLTGHRLQTQRKDSWPPCQLRIELCIFLMVSISDFVAKTDHNVTTWSQLLQADHFLEVSFSEHACQRKVSIHLKSFVEFCVPQSDNEGAINCGTCGWHSRSC